MKCNNCKKEIADDSKFCEHCGTKILNETQTNELTQKIIDHLNFLGYETMNVTTDANGNDNFLATNKNKSNLVIRNIKGIGILIFATYNLKTEKVKKSRSKFLDYLNKMNTNTFLCSYSLSDTNQLVISSWLPPHYNKPEFTNFLDLFESDIKRQFSIEGFMDYA